MIGVVLILGWTLVALFPTLFAPQDIPLSNLPLQKPGAVAESGYMYWLGTDANGEDILLSLIYATRLTLVTAYFSLFLSYVFSIVIVLIFAAGIMSGWKPINSALRSALHEASVLPTLVVYILLVSFSGHLSLSAALAITFLCGSSFYGLLEHIALKERNSERKLASTVLRYGLVDLFDRLFFAFALVLTLEFLKLWIPLGWGVSLAEARLFMSSHPHMGLPYLFAIFSFLIGINLLRVESQKYLADDASVLICADLTLTGDRLRRQAEKSRAPDDKQEATRKT